MSLLKSITYIVTSSVATIAYREGHEPLMWAMMLVGIVMFSYEFTQYALDGKHPFLEDIVHDFFADGTKKENQRS